MHKLNPLFKHKKNNYTDQYEKDKHIKHILTYLSITYHSNKTNTNINKKK